MNLPKPVLTKRLLPLMDIIFILLAFFMILPHGRLAPKESDIAAEKKMNLSWKRINVVEDVPFYFRFLPGKRVSITTKVIYDRWKSKLKHKRISNQKEWQKFLKNEFPHWLEEVIKTFKIQVKRWKKLLKTSNRQDLGRKPKILFFLEIHPLATIGMPLRFIQKIKSRFSPTKKLISSSNIMIITRKLESK